MKGGKSMTAEIRPLAATLAVLFLGLAPAGLASCQQAGEPSTAEELRRRMVREQIAEPPGRREPVRDTAVLRSMRTVPRHRFVPSASLEAAYADRPLPIPQGQTISQPYIVAAMTALVEPRPGDVVFELGTGSGYQAAVLAEIVDHVYSVEIEPELAASARRRLQELGYANVSVREGDGWAGWPDHAPFDGIVVTAAADSVPPPLLEQLAPGGRMVLPVESGPVGQVLLLVEKREDGSVVRRRVTAVRFVPLRRER